MDEIFFIDLPGREERRSIFQILLKRHLWDLEADDTCLRLSEGFSAGAEIEQTVVEATLQALHQGEALTLFHLQRCLKETIPLSTAMGGQDRPLEEMGKGPGTAGQRQQAGVPITPKGIVPVSKGGKVALKPTEIYCLIQEMTGPDQDQKKGLCRSLRPIRAT